MRIGVEFRAIVDEIVDAENQKAKAAPVPKPYVQLPKSKAKKPTSQV